MKRILASVLALSLALTAMVGCGGKKETAEGDGKGSEKMIVRHNFSADPETIDPALNAAVDGAIVLVNTFEGLMRTDKDDKAIPGVAEKFEVSEDKLTYTFHLRDSKWSDGTPITAQDFEYSWKRVLDPKTAADYAYQMYYIKNAEKFNSGAGTADEVGVKAVDEKTLQVTLEAPTPYFLELTAFPCYFPVKKDVVEKDPEKWALNPETHISNGPFKVVKWEHNNEMVLEKNPNYYGADRIKLDGITFTMINEQATALSAFEAGELDYVEDLPSAQMEKYKAESKEFHIYPNLGTSFYVFNVNEKPVDDVRVRRALTLAIDRQKLIDAVLKAGQIPATGFVPTGIKMPNGKDFRELNGDFGITPEANVAEAKKLLAEAGYPDGKGFPKVPLIYNTNEGNKAIAEAIQEMWKKNLGIEIELQNQEWKVFQETRDNGDFVMARHAWIGDYVDPMTFLDMWLSTSGNNNAQWKNPEYDATIKAAKAEADPMKRYEIMAQAEKMMMDANIAMPIYYYTNPELIKDYVKGVKVSPLGFVYYDEVTLEKK